jgi:hypothetical protein
MVRSVLTKGTSFCGSPVAAAKQRRALADRAL